MSISNTIGGIQYNRTFTTVDIQQSGTFTLSRTLGVSSSATPYTPTIGQIVDMVWLGYVDGTNTEGAVVLAEVDGSLNVLDELQTTLVTRLTQGQIIMPSVNLEAGKSYALARRTTQGDGRVYCDDGYLRVYV